MRTLLVIALLPVLAWSARLSAQGQRRTPVGNATFAVHVADPAGTPLGGVRVIVQGPAAKDSRTENGRIAFENMPVGTYRFRFEREGFITLEREVVGRPGAPIDVKVALTPAPEPPKPMPPPEPVAPPPAPPISTTPVGLDISAFLEKNFIGRAATKSSNLACAAGGGATLLQFRDSVAEHAHDDADEFLYVVAGSGVARVGGTDQPLNPSVFVMIPRTVAHTFTVRGKTPLVVLSVRGGEACQAAPAQSRN